jgi:dTMP kinase
MRLRAVLRRLRMTHPRFITFEGGEGSGKSTQAGLLAEKLRALGHAVVVTREPGGSPLSEKVRDLLLSAKPQSPVSEFLLFAAARAEHLHVTIAPALKQGAFVICDRFIDSTRVYQGDLGHVDPTLIADIERATVEPFIPRLTLVLDVPAQTGLKRAALRGEMNHYDRKDLGWHEKLRAAFRRLAETERSRCVLIDGDRDAASISADIWSAVQQRLDIR